MSQKRQNRPSPTTRKPAETAARNTGIAPDMLRVLVQEPVLNTDTDTDNGLRKWFWGVAAAMLVLMIVMSLRVGVNGDDSFQNPYCDRLLSWYGTMGQDTSALSDPVGFMHLYGGFYEIVSGVTNKAVGLTADDPAYHDVRHVWNALFGFLAMLLTGLLAKEMGGWRAGLLALLVMFLSPRFLGDSLMNPKDIPFAAGNIMALLFMVRLYREMPSPSWKTVLGLISGIAMALAARAGALLLIAYLGMFAFIHFWMRYRSFAKLDRFLPYVKWGAIIAVGGFILGILFWPYALVSPIANPIEALGAFTKYGVKIRLLYKGENLMSDQVDWQYPVQWILRTIPPFALVGLAAGVVLLRTLMKRYDPVAVLLIAFTAIFPVAYIIYQDSVLHDGWRHLTFVYPSIVLLGVLALHYIESKTNKWVFVGAAVLLLAQPAAFIANNSQYSYVYFNPAFGGMKGNFGNFETDYWGISLRQGVEWLENEGIIKPDMKDTVTIGTNFVYNVDRYIKKKYNGKVKLAYVKYNNRYDYAWDYGLFVSRFVPGPQLRGGWPEKSSTIHTINANGVPLVAIMKPKSPAIFTGVQASKTQNWPVAIENLKVAFAASTDNEIAQQGLANAYLQGGQPDSAKMIVDKMLATSPKDPAALNLLGMCYINKNDAANAEATFNNLVAVSDDYPVAYYYLALIQAQKGDNQMAIQNVEKCREKAPTFKPIYQLGAQIAQAMGNQQLAQQYLQVMQQLQ